MPILEILHFPDSRLRTRAQPVAEVNDEIRQLVDDMIETMYAAPGIGLAATQVNIHLQVLVTDISDNKDAPFCMINPEIVQAWGEEEMEEGCLSVPETYEVVQRAESIRVKYLDRDGKKQDMTVDDIQAVVIQHEIDHLKGKLFVDYISPLKRNRIRKKLEKMEKNGQLPAYSKVSSKVAI